MRRQVSRLKAARLRRGWSQTKVTMLTGIATPDLSAIEHGTKFPHPGWRRRLAAAFRVPERELFPDESA